MCLCVCHKLFSARLCSASVFETLYHSQSQFYAHTNTKQANKQTDRQNTLNLMMKMRFDLYRFILVQSLRTLCVCDLWFSIVVLLGARVWASFVFVYFVYFVYARKCVKCLSHQIFSHAKACVRTIMRICILYRFDDIISENLSFIRFILNFHNSKAWTAKIAICSMEIYCLFYAEIPKQSKASLLLLCGES